MPELAASLNAAKKKEFELVIGNIFGSNIINIVLVFSTSLLINKNEKKLKFILVNEENNSSIPNKILLQRDSYKLYTILKHINEHCVLLLDVGILLQDNLFNVLEELTIINPI